MKKGIIALAVMATAGCSSVETMTQSSDTVSYTIDDRRKAMRRANSRAKDHCAKTDKVATLLSTDKVGRKGRVVTYKCVAK